MTLTRPEALALLQEYTASDALRKHMYAVEIAMRAMAERADEDPEAWGLVGLLHDFDYERFPNAGHSPQPHLDRVHTVFGQVREGMTIVNDIRQNDVINSIRVS